MTCNRSVRNGFPLQYPHWPFPTISSLSTCQLSLTILIAFFHLLNWTWGLLGSFPRPFLKPGVTLATSHSFEIQQFTDLSSRLYPIATSWTASYPNSFRTEGKSHLLLVVSLYPFHQSVIKSLPLTLQLESVPHSTLQWADPLQEFGCPPLQWHWCKELICFLQSFLPCAQTIFWDLTDSMPLVCLKISS